jgi:predicted AAA+ superfamily ATPase
MEVIRRFLVLPKRSLFLFGPRGTGKSTWLRHLLPDSLYIDLLVPDVYRELSARPERLRDLVAGSPDRDTVVVDEIQRVPELLTVVHSLLESALRRRFVLTGSSARKLRRGGYDLLAGRAVLRTLHPFMAAELPRFHVDEALEQGLLPLVVTDDDPEDVLRAYANLYLEQEVRVEGWARNVGDFARFLEAVSFSHASVLNISAVARECQVERKTVTAYVEVLEDLLLAFRVPVFTRRARRRTSVHPKLYLFDAGVFRSIRPHGPLDSPGEIDGAALEGLVAQHLRAWIAYSGARAELAFWRTASGLEVDLVL